MVGFEPTKNFSLDLQSNAVDHLATFSTKTKIGIEPIS